MDPGILGIIICVSCFRSCKSIIRFDRDEICCLEGKWNDTILLTKLYKKTKNKNPVFLVPKWYQATVPSGIKEVCSLTISEKVKSGNCLGVSIPSSVLCAIRISEEHAIWEQSWYGPWQVSLVSHSCPPLWVTVISIPTSGYISKSEIL